ncbi:alpha/beta fold hydrolase [Pseudomonas abyssi]|jgi:pimeloyl-ACP methyl ester carboxylesterase|uniref:Alpha/beta hydrolase n=1 Tax=Pseudomonas abyssi TaxID=170540 RepID=A0A2A3MJP1_9PSED|nr:alpha/beta hydrolase [Pseudomonas abyssi]MAD01417.1 alpha/beta hydrolase [Pseudomonadales bacterium]PBK05060.1 alpha/beta hydrolase [Pseudomonas abyssi]|tara:strand:- start:16673 stop:17572 length:900 start_codon:yes stop_codon:yes gene_type:complete
MKAEHDVVETLGGLRVHTHYYSSPAPQGTVILVNGSLATTAAFAQTVRYLQPHFNVVLFDEPYAGQSKQYNSNRRPITKEQEASILLELIERYRADHLMSFSWGGASALLALAQRPARIRKAVVLAFSPLINSAMRDYLERGIDLLVNCERKALGELLNSTIGEHLPSLVKRFNFRHIVSLDEHEYHQMAFHVSQVLTQDTRCYLRGSADIDTPILFVNGDLDRYTSPEDAQHFNRYIRHCRFATVRGAGHFLDMESREAWAQTRDAVLGYLAPSLDTVGEPAERISSIGGARVVPLPV